MAGSAAPQLNGRVLTLVGAATACGFLLGTLWSKASKEPHVENAFQLVIWKKFRAVEDRDRFLELFRPLGKYVAENEPGALAYEVSIADNDPTKILLFERYISKQYYLDVHRSSTEFSAFKEAVAGFQFESGDGQSYIEANLGRF